MKLDFKEIFLLQSQLDKTIQENHKVSYPQIHEKLKLALLVELCELANEVRFFKYWSNKKPSPKSVVLEEYVDGIHFITSLCLSKKANSLFNINDKYKKADKDELTKLFLDLSSKIKSLDSVSKIKDWYKNYLILGIKLGLSIKDIQKSYINKNKINFKRQENNY